MKWKCGNCGAEFDEGTKFCPNCGTKINGKTPQTDQTFTCGNCGGEFKGRVGYCPHCGSPIIWDDDNNERLTSTQKIFLIISTIVAIVNVLLYINNFFSNIFFGLFVFVSPVLPFFTWVNLDKIQTEYNISSKLAINGLFSVIIATFIFLSSRAIYEMVRLTDSTQESEQILVEKESEAERKESEKKKEAPEKPKEKSAEEIKQEKIEKVKRTARSLGNTDPFSQYSSAKDMCKRTFMDSFGTPSTDEDFEMYKIYEEEYMKVWSEKQEAKRRMDNI